MGSYYVIVTCRNSQDSIEKAIMSLYTQTIKPEYIIIINDGSTDNTQIILDKLHKSLDNIYLITNPDMGYDVTRIVKNWNKAIKLVKEEKLKNTDYHMIGTDDTIYENTYAQKIISFMDNHPQYAIVSGSYDENKYEKPHGAGRFVRNTFFFNTYTSYPEKMGYESAILLVAKKNNLDYKILKEAKFEHIRPLGQNHHFYEFGASMRTLGYHPIFAFGRFFSYFFSGKPIGRLGAIYMIYHYIFYKPQETGYNSMYSTDLRKFTKNMQLNKIKSILKLKSL